MKKEITQKEMYESPLFNVVLLSAGTRFLATSLDGFTEQNEDWD